jgi:hypothetical protein
VNPQFFPLGISEEAIVEAAKSATEQPVAGSLYDGLSRRSLPLCQLISAAVREAYDRKVSYENPDALKKSNATSS